MHSVKAFVMRRLRSIFYILLTLLWVPLTQHCGWEALGLVAKTCTAVVCSDVRPCAGDACKEMENGSYKSSSDGIKASAPQLLAVAGACLNLASVNPIVAQPPPPSAVERPFDWVPSWQFVRRAAPPARAPALIAA